MNLLYILSRVFKGYRKPFCSKSNGFRDISIFFNYGLFWGRNNFLIIRCRGTHFVWGCLEMLIWPIFKFFHICNRSKVTVDRSFRFFAPIAVGKGKPTLILVQNSIYTSKFFFIALKFLTKFLEGKFLKANFFLKSFSCNYRCQQIGNESV